MAWTPLNQIPDTRPLIANLLGYIEANQSEALLWANDGGASLPTFADIYSNASGRVATAFPNLTIVADRIKTPYDQDVLAASWSVVIETAISGSTSDEITTTTRLYQAALESMLANITGAELLADSRNISFCKLETVDTVFDELRANTKSEYLQIFTTAANYTIYSSGY